GCDAAPGFNLFDRFGLHPVPVCVEERPVLLRRHPSADRQKYVVGIAQVGTRIVDSAAERFEDRSLRIDYGADATVDGKAAEIGRPRNPGVFETAVERREKP